MAANPPMLVVPREEDHYARAFMQWLNNRQIHPEQAFLHVLQQTITGLPQEC